MNNSDSFSLADLTTHIVSSYVSNNEVRPDQIATLIADVHAALQMAPAGAVPPPAPQEPVVSIRKSVTPDYIICLEDGQKFKSIRRHLRNVHNLTPEDYREKWGLKADYPMTAPSYSASRSRIAKQLGLGRKPFQTAEVPASAGPAEAPAPAKRRRSIKPKG